MSNREPACTAIREFAAVLEPFAALSPSALDQLLSTARLRRYAAKELIFLEGDESAAFFVVKSGRAALLKSSLSGKELIVELLLPGSFFGVVAVLDQKPYPVTARAQTAADVLVFGRDPALSVMSEYPELKAAFTLLLTARLRSAHNFARALAHDRVETRISALLLALADRLHAAEAAGHSAKVDITRQELADLAGVTLETASRVVHAFEREGLVKLAGTARIEITGEQGLKRQAVAE